MVKGFSADGYNADNFIFSSINGKALAMAITRAFHFIPKPEQDNHRGLPLHFTLPVLS